VTSGPVDAAIPLGVGVEAVERLVEQGERHAEPEGEREPELLAHAAGVAAGDLGELVGQVECLEPGAGGGLGLVRG